MVGESVGAWASQSCSVNWRLLPPSRHRDIDITMVSSDGTASASPTTSERDCSTKKRFSQTTAEQSSSSSSAETLLLSGLEAGVLKLERDSPTAGGGGGAGLYASSSTVGLGYDNRMPLRARISEVSAFVAVFALVASSVMQIAMVWVSFWMRVEELRTRSVSFHRRTIAFPLWGLWVAALLGYRRMIYKRIAPDMAVLFMHAEILALVVLFMTGELSWDLRSVCLLSRSCVVVL